MIDPMSTKYSVTGLVEAPLDHTFALLADPGAHHRFDETGMVGAPESPDRLVRVGQVFVMNMTYQSDDHVERYQSDNYVTSLDKPRLIEWATATHGGPLLGWCWRYELEPVDEATRVTLTYDWTDTTQENADRFGVPLVDEIGLQASLALIAKAAATDEG